jgi:hypothetical protein
MRVGVSLEHAGLVPWWMKRSVACARPVRNNLGMIVCP